MDSLGEVGLARSIGPKHHSTLKQLDVCSVNAENNIVNRYAWLP